MARLQVLKLPMTKLGEVEEQPFALVMDQADMRDDVDSDRLVGWARDCGARTMLVTPDTVDVIN